MHTNSTLNRFVIATSRFTYIYIYIYIYIIITQISCLACHWITISERGSNFRATQVYSNGNHGTQYGGCEVSRMKRKASQRHSSIGVWRRNLIGQLPRLNCSVRKVLQLIVIYLWEKMVTETYSGHVQIVLPFTQVNKKRVLALSVRKIRHRFKTQTQTKLTSMQKHCYLIYI